jgi:hypothetical protein
MGYRRALIAVVGGSLVYHQQARGAGRIRASFNCTGVTGSVVRCGGCLIVRARLGKRGCVVGCGCEFVVSCSIRECYDVCECNGCRVSDNQVCGTSDGGGPVRLRRHRAPQAGHRRDS